MADPVGLTASIIGIAGAGVKLSTTLYTFVDGAARAGQDITDIAGDVALTSNVLNSVGNVFQDQDAKSLISKTAVQDADSIIKRCDVVFTEIQQVIEKRMKTKKDGKMGVTALGKLAWPLKEHRVELLRRRLDSLKTSLLVLLQVLQFAGDRARGKLEKQALDEERDGIRRLHQRQQESLKSLQLLEDKLGGVSLDDDNTLAGSNAPSRVSTMSLMAHPPTMGPQSTMQRHSGAGTQERAKDVFSSSEDSEDSEETITDESTDFEHITAEDLRRCAQHAEKLLRRIASIQRTFDDVQPTARRSRNHVRKMYRRFCRRFESDAFLRTSQALPSSLPLPEFSPPPRPQRDTGSVPVPGYEVEDAMQTQSRESAEQQEQQRRRLQLRQQNQQRRRQLQLQQLQQVQAQIQAQAQAQAQGPGPTQERAQMLQMHTGAPGYTQSMPMMQANPAPHHATEPAAAPEEVVIHLAPTTLTNVPGWDPAREISASIPGLEPESGNLALRDYQIQLYLLERHKKKRGLASSQLHGLPSKEPKQPKPQQSEPEQSELKQSEPTHVLEDYQPQLMLLEEQCKKRLLMSRQEQGLASSQAPSSVPASPRTPQSGSPEQCPFPGCEYHVRGSWDRTRHVLTHHQPDGSDMVADSSSLSPESEENDVILYSNEGRKPSLQEDQINPILLRLLEAENKIRLSLAQIDRKDETDHANVTEEHLWPTTQANSPARALSESLAKRQEIMEELRERFPSVQADRKSHISSASLQKAERIVENYKSHSRNIDNSVVELRESLAPQRSNVQQEPPQQTTPDETGKSAVKQGEREIKSTKFASKSGIIFFGGGSGTSSSFGAPFGDPYLSGERSRPERSRQRSEGLGNAGAQLDSYNLQMDMGRLDGPDVLENFDFDSFLHEKDDASNDNGTEDMLPQPRAPTSAPTFERAGKRKLPDVFLSEPEPSEEELSRARRRRSKYSEAELESQSEETDFGPKMDEDSQWLTSGAREEKDIVDILLDKWTVPIAV